MNIKRIEILKAILIGICTSPAVTDVIWMPGGVTSESVYEALCGILLDEGMTESELEELEDEINAGKYDIGGK